MSKSKTKDLTFYTELVCTTILSLVAASMWIEWIKSLARLHFENHPSALMGFALTLTLLAIFGLQYIFAESRKKSKKEEAP